MRVIVGITGASGIVIAVELLQRLRNIGTVETHLIITDGGALTIRDETNFDVYSITTFTKWTRRLQAAVSLLKEW